MTQIKEDLGHNTYMKRPSESMASRWSGAPPRHPHLSTGTPFHGAGISLVESLQEGASALITDMGNTFFSFPLRQFPAVGAAVTAAVLEHGLRGAIARRQGIRRREVGHRLPIPGQEL